MVVFLQLFVALSKPTLSAETVSRPLVRKDRREPQADRGKIVAGFSTPLADWIAGLVPSNSRIEGRSTHCDGMTT